MVNYKGLAINLVNSAAVQYCFYNFNSMCKFGDVYLGANEDGIHILEGSNDNGVDIDAFFELVLSDWGISNYKKIRRAFIGCLADGVIKVTFTTDKDGTWNVEFRPGETAKQQGNAVKGRRDILGRYWNVRLENINGSDFKIDAIELIVNVLDKRRRGSTGRHGSIFVSIPELEASLTEV